jgi:hypothetical protein
MAYTPRLISTGLVGLVGIASAAAGSWAVAMEPATNVGSTGTEFELTVGNRLELVAVDGPQHVFLRRDMTVEIEAIGGGGGGGGSTRGHYGGTGGQAGEYKYVPPTKLLAGTYIVEVGLGGRGGMVKRTYDDGAIDHGESGALTRIYKMGGGEVVKADGGVSGTPNGTGRPTGDPGQDLLNGAGIIVAKGGQGGSSDRPGASGTYPGAGGGGGGVFRGPSSFRTGSGANGRVIMHALEP